MRVPEFALLLALPLAGCTSGFVGSKSTVSERDVAELQRRVLELQRKAAASEVEIARLREQMAVLEQRLQEQQPSSRVPVAQAAAGPSSQPVARPPRIEEEDLEEPDGADRGGEEVLTPLEARQEPPAAPPGTGDGAGAGVVEPLEPAAQAVYDKGYTLYHQGRYSDAEASFRRFLDAYPDTELSDNAQYWIGECRYARRDYEGALAAFREVGRRYPESNKIPDSLLKSGQCLEQLGDVDGARLHYDEVVRRFPHTAAAALARERRTVPPS